MEYEPDYSRYTLNELIDASEHIDRDRYAERARVLEEEIRRRMAQPQAAEQRAAINPYKTFGPRFLAGIVDGLVFMPVALLSKIIWSHSGGIPVFLLVLWSIVETLSFTVYSILMTGRYGQTLGKMAAKVKVFDLSGSAVSMFQALRRDSVVLLMNVLYLAAQLPAILTATPLKDSVTLYIIAIFVLGPAGLLWFTAEMITMLTNKRRRAIHDLIADSVVMRIPYYAIQPTPSSRGSSRCHVAKT